METTWATRAILACLVCLMVEVAKLLASQMKASGSPLNRTPAAEVAKLHVALGWTPSLSSRLLLPGEGPCLLQGSAKLLSTCHNITCRSDRASEAKPGQSRAQHLQELVNDLSRRFHILGVTGIPMGNGTSSSRSRCMHPAVPAEALELRCQVLLLCWGEMELQMAAGTCCVWQL